MIQLFVIGDIEKTRGELFPLLKPFIKNKDFTDTERIKLYGISEKDFKITETIKDANYLVLPMSWNYYEANKKTEEITQLIQEKRFQDKRILSFTSGDFGVKTPYLKNLFVFRCNGEKSKLNSNNLGLPVFIEDPLFQYFKTDTITIRNYIERPTIGFCGQANGSLFLEFKEVTRSFLRNIQFSFGLRKLLPQPLFSTSKLRHYLLHQFIKSDEVNSNFIFRKKYRAGVTNQKDKEKTTQEFYDNLQCSDYVLCVRGGGNFSVRLYETLALGRIPIFVNTDCLLPLDNTINWKEHVVWVEESERKYIAEKVNDFHSNLTTKDFIDLQQKNRSLWKEKLNLKGFYNTIFHEI